MTKTAVLLSFLTIVGVFSAVSHVKHSDAFWGQLLTTSSRKQH